VLKQRRLCTTKTAWPHWPKPCMTPLGIKARAYDPQIHSYPLATTGATTTIPTATCYRARAAGPVDESPPPRAAKTLGKYCQSWTG